MKRAGVRRYLRAVGWMVASTCASPADEERLDELIPSRVAYAYDGLGRLAAVSDRGGETAVYRYDEVGNVVAIDRRPSDVPSVVGVVPARAGVGDEVVVQGTGFAADPGDNSVEVGGAEAEVVGGNEFALRVEVPEGATSGAVTVEAPDGRAASGDEAFVLDDEPVPVVEGFSPAVVEPGGEVTVEGRGFSTEPLLDAVRVGGSYARVVSASETELVVAVPATVTAGGLSVATPGGAGEADGEVFVAPPPYAAEDVGFTGRVEMGEAATVGVGDEGSVGLVAFEGERGRYVAIGGDDVGCSTDVGLVAPGGLVLRDAANWRNTPSCDEPLDALGPLPVEGTYLVVVAPGSTDEFDLTVEDAPAPEPPSEDDDDGGEGTADETHEGEGEGEGDAGHGDGGDAGGGGSEPGDGDGSGGGLGAEPVEPGPLAPPDGPLGGDGRYPVDLVTGVLAFQETDLAIADVLPLVLARSYTLTPHGVGEWAFGKGSALDFDLTLRVGGGHRVADLELPTGLNVAYERTTEGYDVDSAVFEHTATASALRGSRIVWAGFGWELTLLDGTTLVFNGDDGGPLRAVRNPAGNQLTVRRGRTRSGLANGNVASVHSPSGRSLTFAYDEGDRLIEVTDHLGRAVTYGYDGEDRLSTVTYPDGPGRRYGYDARHRLTTIGPLEGPAWVTNEYDDAGRVVRQARADGSTFSFAYTLDGDGRVTRTEVTDPRGAVRRLDVADGYWVADTLAAGTPDEQAYRAEREDGTRLVTALVGPDGTRTTYSYDDVGFPTTITDAAGTGAEATTTIAYDGPLHQASEVTGPDGLTVTYGYDEAGNVTAVTDPAGAETSYAYDGSGRVTSVSRPDGVMTEAAYEGQHRVTVTGPAGHRASGFYDAAGRLAAATGPAGNESRWRYDDAGRPTALVAADGTETSVAYGTGGNVTAVTDARGNTTRYAYDPLGRLSGSTDPLGATESYRYSPAGDLVSYTDRRGVVTTHAYDRLGRVTRTSFGVTEAGAESRIDYAYGPAGRVSEVTDSAYGTITFAYDALGRLTSEASPQGTVAYTYDPGGRRTSMTVEGGPETTYDYDDAGRLATITQGDATVAAQRDDAGRVAALDLPAGVQAAYDYDDRSLLAHISYTADGGDRDLGGLGYRYDPAGRRVGLTGTLAATKLPDPLEGASYDAANRLTGWDGTTLAYDPAGNLLDDGEATYTWDARGQLTAVDLPAAGTPDDAGADGSETTGNGDSDGDGREGQGTSFGYDPLGRRSEVTTGGTTTTTTYAYDRYNVIRRQTGDGDPVDYLTGLGIDETFARITPEGASAYLVDGLGSTLALTDPDGEIATTYTRDPHGLTHTRGDEDENPFGFTGREHDDATGLVYYRARYYQPEHGRFTSPDPLGHAAGDPNHYAYAAGDPVNNTDPSGLCLDTALTTIVESFAIVDAFQAITDERIAGTIGSDEHLAGLDQLTRQARTIAESFIALCSAELVLAGIPGALAAGIPGRGLPRRLPGPRPPAGTGAARAGNIADDVARTGSRAGDDTTRVGRWMGPDEHAGMVDSGHVQVGDGGTTYVAHPANPEAYMRQARPGTY